eukprot:SAG22_NODE_11974_length_461_cov_0.986188_1_plen_21_part_01
MGMPPPPKMGMAQAALLVLLL